MNKFDRIRILTALGMNTEDSVLVSNSGDWERHRGFLHQFEKYSVRTFRDKAYGRSNPHFPIISREELVDRYSKPLSEGLKLIVASPIDPQDAELAGALLYDAGVVSAEVALRSGNGPACHRRREDRREREDRASRSVRRRLSHRRGRERGPPGG